MAVTADQDSRQAIVGAAAERWANDLVDLSSRNGLVYFKESKSATLDLTHCDPAVLARFLAGKKVHLRQLYPDAERHAKACTVARNLRRKIVEFDEEQGVAAGHVACGLLVMDAPRLRGAAALPALRAPLALRRIEIHAKTAGEADFTVELQAEAEPNEVLLYVLERVYGLNVDTVVHEDVRQSLAEHEDPAVQAKQMFRILAENLAAMGFDARYEERAVADVFSFEKMPMAKDLQQSGALLARHDVIAALAGHAPTAAALMQRGGPPPPNPDSLSPADSLLVLDADSSQHAAVSVALSGRHVLIDGPPGTGKSQTIANVIACLSAAGKRVLFVSEKRAAIEAVTQRLEDIDLDHLVFDLHDQRINRKYVAGQLAQGLDRASAQPDPRVGDLHDRLSRRREDVRRYATELHREHDPWGVSFYQAVSWRQQLPASCASTIRLRRQALQVFDQRTLTAAVERLKDFVDKGGLRIQAGGSVWSRAEVRSETEVQQVLEELDDLIRSSLREAHRELNALIKATSLRPPDTIDAWQQVFDLLSEVEQSAAAFGPDVFQASLDDLTWATADRGRRTASGRSMPFWRRWALVRTARKMHTGGVRDRRVLHEALVAAAEQCVRWRRISVADIPPGVVPGLSQAAARYSRLRNQLAAVAACAKLDDLMARPAPDVRQTLDQLDADRNTLHVMPDINALAAWFTGHGLADLLDELATKRTSAQDAARTLQWIWLSSVIEELRNRAPALSRFIGRQHTRIVAEFAQADEEYIRANADRVRRAVAVGLQAARDAHPDQDAYIRRQAALRARHVPVRKLVEKAPDVLLALHPCWAMSPLVVSRMLPAERLFDTVVFDEASQIEPHDAVAAIMRGRQLIVAGDDQQLPPTTFFKRSLRGGTEDEDADDDIDLTLYESILDRAKSVISQRHRLRWHYRSLDERLIAFSNTEIYGGELITFPGTGTAPPIRLEAVDGRALPGQDGSAPEEVQRVVELALQCAQDRREESLGVITLSQRHANRVEAALRDALRERPELAEFFSDEKSTTRRFFVKNLERVQGDERETVILSLGYAKNAAGKVTVRGPLTHQGGERRLNVAVTRARRRMIVVSSFSHLDMSPSVAQATHRGPELLRLFLEFAHRQGRSDLLSRSRDVDLNGFEQSVYAALKGADVPAFPQWGVSDYRIDFALAHPQRPGQMVLAVETDGLAYHRAGSARDRDRLRQSQLERLGWRFHRVWSMDWFRDPQGELDRIVHAWHEAVTAADRPGAAPAAGHRPRLSATPPQQRAAAEAARGPRPAIAAQARSADYSDADLQAVYLWLLGDGLPVARSERVQQALTELGLTRRGKITDRLQEAFELVHTKLDDEGR